MKLKPLQFHPSLSLVLFVVAIILTAATFYADYWIYSSFYVTGTSEAVAGKAIELKKDLYNQIIDKNKDSSAFSPKGNIGRVDPFAAVE
jgi:hypothetical protein